MRNPQSEGIKGHGRSRGSHVPLHAKASQDVERRRIFAIEALKHDRSFTGNAPGGPSCVLPFLSRSNARNKAGVCSANLMSTSVERPQSGSDWVHEIKFDGYRIQMRIESGKVTLKTRKGLDWTPKLCAIATAARALPD